MVGWLVNSDLVYVERRRRGIEWSIFSVFAWRATKIISLDGLCPSWNSVCIYPDYKLEGLLLELTYSFCGCKLTSRSHCRNHTLSFLVGQSVLVGWHQRATLLEKLQWAFRFLFHSYFYMSHNRLCSKVYGP